MNMKTSVAVLSALLSACTASYSADTTADVGRIEDGSHVVVSVDHTRLVNGTTEVIANDNGTASIATASSVYGNPIFIIHAGSVFTGDTAAHSKTFTEDYVVDFSGVDLSGASPPFVVQDGWRFVGPTDDSVAKNLWCGPADYPAWQFSLSNYDSGSPTATHVEDPGAQFSGSITVSRPRGVLIATVDNVLAGSTETASESYSRKFTTSQAHEYVFVNPGDSNPIFSINPVDVSLFNNSIGIGSSTIDSLGVLYGIGKFQKNGYTYVFPYTDSTGSGTYTIATTSHFSGYATRNWVNGHEWDWSTQVTNAPSFASEDHDHDHLTSDNGEWRLVQMDEGSAVVMPAYYYGEDNGLGVKFMPSIPIEDLHDICSTNAAARIPSSMEIKLDGSVSSAGYGYTMGSGNTTTFYATNKVSYAEGVVFPDTVQITFDVPFTSGRIYIYNIPILCGSKKTLVSTDYIRTKLSGVSANVQTAEDARVALTNLITILKNL